MQGASWSRKRKAARAGGDDDDDQDEKEKNTDTVYSIYSINNHVHFNDDVTPQSMFLLARELRLLAQKLRLRSITFEAPVQPIYLHVSTSGGEISAAFSVVDCIKNLGVPVYSVVDGFVASAGTLITLAAERRFIEANAYMLIHQLSSGVWGKMNDIHEQVDNLKKLMEHITAFYLEHTTLKTKVLQKLLLRDVTWNAQESITRGIADEIYARPSESTTPATHKRFKAACV